MSSSSSSQTAASSSSSGIQKVVAQVDDAVGAGPGSTIQEEVDYEGLGEGFPLHINMIAGALAGISEHAVMFPVDVIRVSLRVEAGRACQSQAERSSGQRIGGWVDHH